MRLITGWFEFFTLAFSSPSASPMPPPTSPAEDPAALQQVEDARRQAAAMDLMSTGRRSTMFAGKTTKDSDFLSAISLKKKSASDSLGGM